MNVLDSRVDDCSGPERGSRAPWIRTAVYNRHVVNGAPTEAATPIRAICPEWLRKVQAEAAQRETEREAATIYQIAFWQDARFRGSLLPRSAERDEESDTTFAVDVNRDLAKVFASGFSVVDWQQRQRLQKKPLALCSSTTARGSRSPLRSPSCTGSRAGCSGCEAWPCTRRSP